MKNPFKKDQSKEFDDLIAATKAEMQTYGPGTEEWKKSMDDLKSLVAMREFTLTQAISPDMALLVFGQIFTAGLLALVESKGHIIQQKFFALIPRTR